MVFADFADQTASALIACKSVESTVESAAALLRVAALGRKPILTCADGYSAALGSSFCSSLVGHGLRPRRPIRAVSLTADPLFMVASLEGQSYDVMTRQVTAHGAKGGVLVAMSVLGTSPLIISAMNEAHAMGMRVIGLTDGLGFPSDAKFEVEIRVPSTTPAIVTLAYEMICQWWLGQIEKAVEAARPDMAVAQQPEERASA